MRPRPRQLGWLVVLFWGMMPAWGKEVLQLAVSSSIQKPLASICTKFSQKTNIDCKITSASTGHLYAHIMHGMSYDLLLSSDETYTQGLINAHKADPQQRFVLARGKIVLYSADPQATAESLQQKLMGLPNENAAIAIPGATPYGGAAKQVLQDYELWNRIQDSVVYGKNLEHTYNLIASKRVGLGFVALTQLPAGARNSKKYWEPDSRSYKPIMHEVVMLKATSQKKATRQFLAYLQKPETCQFLEDAGFSCSEGVRV